MIPEEVEQDNRGGEGSLSVAKVLKFFVPLGLTSFMMMLTHSILNAGIARTENPEMALAGYAMARSVVFVAQNPLIMLRQTTVSLVNDEHSLRLLSRLVQFLTLIVVGSLAIVAFGPAGEIVFRGIMGASKELTQHAMMALSVLFLLPLTTSLRNMRQGVAILSRQTRLVACATGIRLVFLSVIVVLLTEFTDWPGALIGAVCFLLALGLEAAVITWWTRDSIAKLQEGVTGDEGHGKLTYRTLGCFYAPLILTSLAITVTEPVVNAGLARSAAPELALASYAVSMALGKLLFGPTLMLHQCALAFGDESNSRALAVTRSFVFGCGLIFALLVWVVAFTPAGGWLFRSVIGVSPDVARMGRGTLAVLGFMPLAISLREYAWGILMRLRLTNTIPAARGANLLVIVLTLLAGLSLEFSNPAAVGAAAVVAGQAVEGAVVHWRLRQLRVRGAVAA